MASRSKATKADAPASVHFRALPLGKREQKFKALSAIRLSDQDWIEAPATWRAPFLPASEGAWADYPKLEDLFIYNGSGVMPGRTWIIAPDPISLRQRWRTLIDAPPQKKDELLQPHLNHGELGDRHAGKLLGDALPGFPIKKLPITTEHDTETEQIQYAFRSFDRQWIIADKRVINRPNPELWQSRSDAQIYLTAPSDRSPSNGPALTFTALVPDLHHYAGRGGRAVPLWADESRTLSNIRLYLLRALSDRIGIAVEPEDFLSYIAAVATSPAYTSRFQADLSTPGLRIPMTADAPTFREASKLGRRIIWLHTFGERMTDAAEGRPGGPPRLPEGLAPVVSKEGEISSKPAEMPDTLGYDAGKNRLLVGHGFIDNVPLAVWQYEVSGKQVLVQWFSYRKKDRQRPIMGDRRKPSPLSDIQPDHWLPEYTTELLNVLNVLAMLVELEPQQAELLDRICSGLLISEEELKVAGAFEVRAVPKRKKKKIEKGASLFEDSDASKLAQ
jgi:hypothetical protein